MNRKSRMARRAAKTAAALGLAVGASLGASDAASAAPIGHTSCKAAADHSICLSIVPVGNDSYEVSVAIDVHADQQWALTVLEPDGPAFSAELIGDDPAIDTVLAHIPLRWEAAGDGVLSAELSGVFPRSVLDEDPGSAEDEIYARVTLSDAATGTTRTFASSAIQLRA